MGKTALVFSAGGMFGAYQAGVWAELCDAFQPEIVVGASVGSLNGWLVASGCGGDVLLNRWRALGGEARLRWRLPRRWTGGCLDTSALACIIRRMCEEWTPVREFGVVLTHLPTLRPRLFRWPEAGWKHLLASCSVPAFMEQRAFAGEYFSDGGLVDPLPLAAAVEMGATAVVTVNLLHRRPWAIRQVVRVLRAYSGYRPPDCAGVRLVDISPAAGLGSARDSMYWSRSNTERWIEQGRQDARQARQRVVELWVQPRQENGRAPGCPGIACIE